MSLAHSVMQYTREIYDWIADISCEQPNHLLRLALLRRSACVPARFVELRLIRTVFQQQLDALHVVVHRCHVQCRLSAGWVGAVYIDAATTQELFGLFIIALRHQAEEGLLETAGFGLRLLEDLLVLHHIASMYHITSMRGHYAADMVDAR